VPDVVDSIVLHNGTRKYVIRLTNASDSTGETGVTKVDISGLTGPNGSSPTRTVIEEIEYDVQGFSSVRLYWDHTTDDEIAMLSGTGYKDYRPYGGLVDPGSSGGTGDILLTTIGATTTSTYSILISMRLKQ